MSASITSPKKEKSIFDLGEDILTSNVIPNLALGDIKALGSTCRYLHSITNDSSVWHQLYKEKFGVEPTPFAFSNYKWPDLFRLRQTAKLVTWGKPTGGRLGYSVRNISGDHVSRRFLESSVNRPTLVDNLQETIIADVSAGGFSFQVLTNDGELYTTGVTWNGGLTSGPAPSQLDNLPGTAIPSDANSLLPYRLFGLLPTRTQGVPQPPRPGHVVPRPTPRTAVMPDRVVHDTPPDMRDEENQKGPIPSIKPNTEDGYIRKLKVTNKIVSVSSGRTHFIALDAKGQIWTWDHPKQNLVGVKLKFVNQNDVSLINDQNFITKIVAGWNLSCCFILNVGIVYWTGRDLFEDASLSLEEMAVKAHYKIIPNTSANGGADKVVDIIAGESFIVYLTNQGKIYRVDINNEVGDPEPFELSKFDSYLSRHSQSSSLTPSKFIRLSGGSYRTFVAISDEDQVLIGTKESNNPEVIKELQKKQIISVAVGDYHYLALTKNGDLLSWGLESQSCGCLGLGDSGLLVDSGIGEIVGRSNLRISKPTKVDIKGKVLAIGAAGWQSCAIVNMDT